MRHNTRPTHQTPHTRPRGRRAWPLLALAALASIAAGGAVPIRHYADRVDLPNGRRTVTLYAYPKYYRDAANAWQPTRERFRQVGTEWVADQGVHRLSVRADGRAILTHRGHVLTFQLRGLTSLAGTAIAGKRLAEIDLSAWTLDASAAEQGRLTWRHGDGTTYSVRYVADQVLDEFVISDERRAALKAALPPAAQRWGLDFDITLPPGLTRHVAGKQDAEHDTDRPIEMRGEGCRQRLVPAWVADPRDATGRSGWRERWRIAGGRMVQSLPVTAVDHAKSLRTTVTYQEGVDSYSGCTDADILSNASYVDKNDGAAQAFSLGYTTGAGGEKYRYLCRFDLSAIGACSAVNSATLALYLYTYWAGSSPMAVSSARVRREWGEGTGTWSAANAGEVTWNSAKHGSVTWTTAGCGDTTNDRTATANSLSVTSTAGWKTWNVQPWYEDFLVDGDPNYGTINISDDEGTADVAAYRSRNYATASLRPTLTIDYTPAAAGGSPVAAWLHYQRMRR